MITQRHRRVIPASAGRTERAPGAWAFLPALALMSCWPACAGAAPQDKGPAEAAASQPQTPPFRTWGREALAQIEKDLRVPRTDLYAEWGTLDGQRGSQYGKFSFVWPAGFQLRALAAAAKVDPRRYRPRLIRFADALQRYWGVKEGVGGYMVLTSPSERFYDDNAWILMGLVETYTATRQRKYLTRAVNTLTFLLSGEKKTTGGGIRQHEDKPGGPFTCTTAPAAVGALRLYQITRNRTYLAAAERWYAWLTSKEVGIQDPRDGLYHQWAKRVNGKWDVCLGKRAYQSALPLQVNLLLYQIKKDKKYLSEAQRIAASSVSRWIQPSGAMKETAQWGGSDLTDALLDLYDVDKNPRWLTAVRGALQFLHDKGKDPNGRYGEYWHEVRPQPLRKYHLLHMAPVARAYWRAAAYRTRKQK